jgi:hypoxanthine phosphoribosyltransferase
MTDNLVPVLAREEIESQIVRVATEISVDYQNKPLVLIGVLKGAFVFMADLVRKLDLSVELDFVGVASYHAGTTSSGKIVLTKPISIDLKGKHVLLVEDIVETGLTLEYLFAYLHAFKPASVKLCALLDKPTPRRRVNVTIDYCCHTVGDKFLVGYGLDCNEYYRNLPALFCLKDVS